MKHSISLLFSLLISCSALAHKNDALRQFVVLYTIGDSWDTTKTFFEQPYAEEHSAFLGKLRKEKTIVAGGRYDDTGMIILKARDEDAARTIMDGDVSVKNGLFRFEVYELDVFYKGCLE